MSQTGSAGTGYDPYRALTRNPARSNASASPGLHKTGQMDNGNSQLRQPQHWRALGHLFQTATVLEAKDNVTVVKLDLADDVTLLTQPLTTALHHIRAGYGKWQCIDTNIRLQVHASCLFR